MFTVSLLAAQSQGGGMSFIIMMALMFGVLWFFMIRPQNKKRKELENFRDQLKKGDRVVTIGGIHGKIISINDSTVLMQMEDGKARVEKSAISMDSATMLTEQSAKDISKGNAVVNTTSKAKAKEA